MADDPEVVIDFDIDDKASPKLSTLEKNVGKLGGAVDRASSRFTGMVKGTAMMASFFAIGPLIAGAKGYIEHIDKIASITGVAGDRAAGMSNALQGAGVDAGMVANIFTKLGKAGTKLNEGQKGLAKTAKAYGVELKGGAEKSLLAMSKAVKSGKLGATGIARVLSISQVEAAKLAGAMAEGPEALKASFDDLTKKNAAFNDDGLAGIAKWQDASARVGLAWNRLTAGIVVKLAPALEKLSNKFSGAIDGWMAGAEKFGNFLVKHMDKIIAMAKTYAKIMLVNTATQKLTGGVGIGGVVAGGIGIYKKRAAKLVKAGGAGAAAPAVTAVLASFFKGASSLAPIGKTLLKMAPLGAIFGLIVVAVKALGENFNGITTRLKKTFGGIFATIGRIGGKIASMFSGDSALGKFLGGVGYAFLEVVEKIGQVIGFILKMVEKIVGLIPDIFKGTGGGVFKAQEYLGKRTKEIGRLPMSERADATRRMIAHAKMIMKGTDGATTSKYVAPPKASVPKGKEDAQVYQDFRGSRFDIKQAFAEGYDPDRIAVGFANELGSMGERKLQSGFAPLFTVR